MYLSFTMLEFASRIFRPPELNRLCSWSWVCVSALLRLCRVPELGRGRDGKSRLRARVRVRVGCLRVVVKIVLLHFAVAAA